MASTGVNVKMGVTGVAQFKQNINTARQQMKTMETQLQLTEKQFKATGDQEAYMQEKTELLKAKMEEQKIVISNAESALKQMRDNGITPADKAFQDMQQQLLRTKGDMIDTEQELLKVGDNADDTTQDVSELNDSLNKVGKGINWQNVTDSLHSISDGMGKVMKKAWQMGEAIVKNTLGAGSWADELKTTAAQMSTAEYEVTPEELQRMRKTAGLIDTDVDTIVKAKQKLNKGIGNGTKATVSALEALGIDSKGNPEDVFWAAGEAIMKLSSDTQQEAQANAIFGKSWKDLIPLFQAGRKEYEDTMNSWHVVSNDTIDSLGAMDDQYEKLSGEWETFKMEILGAFAGPLTTGMEKLTGFVSELNEYLETPEGKEMLEQMGNTITQLIEDLTNVNPEDVVNGLKGVVDGLTDGMKWIEKHSDVVVGGVAAFVGAWGLIKTAEGVTTVLKLIDGIQGLSTGGAAAGAAAGASWGSAFASAVLKAAPWLLGLYEILKPSAGSDKLGNNDLIDANGQLTEEAKRAGYDQNGNGELITPNKKYEYVIDALKPGSEWKTTGDAVDKTQIRLRNSRIDFDNLDASADKMNKAADELTGGNNAQKQASSEMTQAAGIWKGLPAQLISAIQNGMAGVKIFLNGQSITDYVSQSQAQNLFGYVNP